MNNNSSKYNRNETYSLNIITKWLKENNLNYIYSSSSAVSNCLVYEHGVTLILNNLKVSIQTHPLIAGWSFAETLKQNDITSDIRHETPEKLFEYLNKIILEDEDKIFNFSEEKMINENIENIENK